MSITSTSTLNLSEIKLTPEELKAAEGMMIEGDHEEGDYEEDDEYDDDINYDSKLLFPEHPILVVQSNSPTSEVSVNSIKMKITTLPLSTPYKSDTTFIIRNCLIHDGTDIVGLIEYYSGTKGLPVLELCSPEPGLIVVTIINIGRASLDGSVNLNINLC